MGNLWSTQKSNRPQALSPPRLDRTNVSLFPVTRRSLIFGLTALCGALSGNLITAGGFASAAGIAGLAEGISAATGGNDDWRFLSVGEVARRLGIKNASQSGLNLPEPDALIGSTRGWLPETIRRVGRLSTHGRVGRQPPAQENSLIRLTVPKGYVSIIGLETAWFDNENEYGSHYPTMRIHDFPLLFSIIFFAPLRSNVAM